MQRALQAPSDAHCSIRTLASISPITPNALAQFENEVSLPLNTKMTDEMVDYVIACFGEAYAECEAAGVVEHFFKRVLDIVLGLIALPFVLIVFIVFAPMIYLEDKGPVFYNAPGVGKNGKPFVMYKFRSMYVNAPRFEDGRRQHLQRCR